jgi:hypothetical protein
MAAVEAWTVERKEREELIGEVAKTEIVSDPILFWSTGRKMRNACGASTIIPDGVP